MFFLKFSVVCLLTYIKLAKVVQVKNIKEFFLLLKRYPLNFTFYLPTSYNGIPIDNKSCLTKKTILLYNS